MKQERRRRVGCAVCRAAGLAVLLAAGCSRPGGPFLITQSDLPAPDAGAPTPIAIMSATPPACTPATASEVLPPRSTVLDMGAQAAPVQDTYFTADLYNLFKSVCGGCHVESNLGNFVVNQATFPTAVTRDVYALIASDDPSVFMPPQAAGGIPFSQRSATDAVVQLKNLLDLWLSQGSPPDAFLLPTQAASGNAGYALNAKLGAQLTNLGSCIPNKPMVGTSTSAMDRHDAMFAAATALPPTLDQTDLDTLDSAKLAQAGVVSYVPTYPLWSDDAQKMRYIRVPRGQSIRFDKATQTFDIPPNTRFYKTFLKKVVDVTGNVTYRKIETRVIVARQDTTAPDGSAQQNALFGTYVWNDDETQATLLTDPLRDGKPFADRLFSIVTDEQKAAQIAATSPANLQSALTKAGVTRHYALPGSERCRQCHMGSPSQDFVLGFTPLQVARRPTGAGGTYEPAVGDELTQLQRLIDYGVITGVDAPGDILPLERSEGTRAPRNQQELAAQAYMIGNCAHCHNPRGFPSVKQPALANFLIFLPGPGPNQGIFQFPLTAVSPVRKRGLLQDRPIPYITPSLYDYPSNDAVSKSFCPDQPSGSCQGTGETATFVLAPWRSLIYRNTETPYDYFDDYAPFPHMPLDTSGHDCRVAKLMGDWMVSIPSRLAHPDMPEDALPVDGQWPANANTDTQPYEEVHPGDSDYPTAVAAAQARLASYHQSSRYGFCPSTYTADIVDPFTQSQVDANLPVTSDVAPISSPTDPNVLLMPALTPIRPNYVSFDDTDPSGDWFPRRPDWESALVQPDVKSFVDAEARSSHLSDDAAMDLTNVMNALLSVKLDDATRKALTTAVPFGLWDTKVPGCNFSGVPTAGSFKGANRPSWMTIANVDDGAPVLVETPGAAVFTTICYNCHGIQADSKGLLADAITNMTGGSARVANLRDGLLGPLDMPGLNRQKVFGADAAKLGLSADDLAARYVAWMALGGTQKHLPQDVLTEVSQSPVVGETRQHTPLLGTPDMLKLGLTLCEQIVGADDTTYKLADLLAPGGMRWSQSTGLVDVNGDAEMWLELCNLENRPIVRVPLVSGGKWTSTTTLTSLTLDPTSLYYATGPDGADDYGANPVLNERGTVDVGVGPGNLFPICVAQPTDPTELQYATAVLAGHTPAIPFCPKEFVAPAHQVAYDQDASGNYVYTDARKWAARGAINAALAVFLYLDQIERDPASRQPLYNQCNLLKGGQ
jgi:mono/diheme cytochrome c family protein